MEMIIQLISGAVGGNAAGAGLKKFSMGPIGNTIAGLVGGYGGGALLGGSVGEGAVGQVASGGIGGIVLMVVAGVVKNMMAKD
ncbi:MAG: hypothetical protein V3U96_11075 [Paracoccaceae bacterium]